jgi:hypothetical protein
MCQVMTAGLLVAIPGLGHPWAQKKDASWLNTHEAPVLFEYSQIQITEGSGYILNYFIGNITHICFNTRLNMHCLSREGAAQIDVQRRCTARIRSYSA